MQLSGPHLRSIFLSCNMYFNLILLLATIHLVVIKIIHIQECDLIRPSFVAHKY